MHSKTRTGFAALALAALAACEPSAPEEPTWADDVRPILAANCVRCHGSPAVNDAPPWFRLDVYEDTFTDDNRQIRGAGAMAEFMWLRTSEETMPPQFPLADYQIETLKNWAALRPDDGEYKARPPKGDRATADGEPVMALTATTPIVEDDAIRLAYELRDPDFDLVTGSLLAIDAAEEQVEITKELHAGRGEVVWDVRSIAEGEWDLVAVIDDGDGPLEVELGSVEVVHGANTAPVGAVLAPARHAIISDLDSPFTVRVRADDLDGDDLDISGIRAVNAAGDVIAIPGAGPVITGEVTDIVWDTADVPAGTWFIEADIDDPDVRRVARSAPFVVSHGTTDEVFGPPDADCDVAEPPIGCLLATRCGWCHTGPYVPGMFMDLNDYLREGDDMFDGAYNVRGRIYNRVFVEQNMPPVSAAQLPVADELSNEDRTRLESWLLGGAPE
jgi:mono/diheme cytochrome c family protein